MGVDYNYYLLHKVREKQNKVLLKEHVAIFIFFNKFTSGVNKFKWLKNNILIQYF